MKLNKIKLYPPETEEERKMFNKKTPNLDTYKQHLIRKIEEIKIPITPTAVFVDKIIDLIQEEKVWNINL